MRGPVMKSNRLYAAPPGGARAVFCLWMPVALGLMAGALADTMNTAPEAPARLSLETAQRRALADNPSLQAVELRVRQAAARVRQAQAAFLPVLDLEWGAAYTQLPDRIAREARQGIQSQLLSNLAGAVLRSPASPAASGVSAAASLVQAGIASGNVPDSVDSYTVRLILGYPVFTGFARRHAYAMARFGARESEAAAGEARRLMLEAVAQVYYGAQLADEQLTIAQADQAFNVRLLEEAKARQRVGTAAMSEVLNFEVRKRASEARVINAEQDTRLAHIALAALMGIDDARLPQTFVLEPVAEASEEAMRRPLFEEMYDKACALRPDLEGARLAAQRARANVGMQRAPYYPSVNAFVSKDATREDSHNFSGQDFSTTFGVTVSYNLFAGGRHRAALAEARFAQQEAERQAKAAEITAAQEIGDALERLAAAQQQLTLQRENASYVEQNREMAQKEFQAGQISLALLNQAQRDLVEAQVALAAARVTLHAAWHALRTATAETLQKHDLLPQ